MIARVLNFFFVALAALSCLALYRVSEDTRVANMRLVAVNHQIAQERSLTSVLQAEWQRVAAPARVQRLAQIYLHTSDAPVMELSAFNEIPRRGENPLDSNPVQDASVIMPASGSYHLAAANGN